MPNFSELLPTNTAGWNLDTYLQAHPEVVNAWNTNESDSNSWGSLENFALAHAKAWGSDAEKANATTYKPAVQQTATATPVAGGNFNQNQTAAQNGQFLTEGTTQTNQNQLTGQVTNQNQSGVQSNQQTQTGTQVGTQSQNTGSTGMTAQQQNTTQTATTAEQQALQEMQNYVEQQQSNKTGTTQQRETGTVTTNTSDTSKPIDTLGFGKLLQDQMGSATETDAARNAFLRDVISTGGTGFNSQVDQAVRQSQSGPGMTGAGVSAGARSAAYAAEQIARNNMGQRLEASGQLAGPTAVQTLSTAANPYIGQQRDVSSTENIDKTINGTYNETGTTNVAGQKGITSLANKTGTSTSEGTNNTSAVNNNTGWSNLLSNQATTNNTAGTQVSNTNTSGTNTGFTNLVGTNTEKNAGVSTANSSQAAAGLIPEGKQVQSGGGCVVCTVGLELGLFSTPRVLRRVIDYKLNKAWTRFRSAARGYFTLYTPFARWLLEHPRCAAYIMPLAKMVVYEELRVSGRRLPFKVGPWLLHWTWHGTCAIVGKLPIVGRVQDETILALTKKFGVNFNVRN